MKYELARKPFAYENPVKANPPEISEQVLETNNDMLNISF